MFDRTFLPEASFEFVVFSDTHYLRNPEVTTSDADDLSRTRHWSKRAAQALKLAAALNPDFVIHLGDLTQAYPGQRDFVQSRAEARAQFDQHGLRPYHVAGNMDIGDKPNHTVPAAWVQAEGIAEWHAQFGPSWYSFDGQDVHFVILNTQIIGSQLPEAELQRQWLETDLAQNRSSRIFVFMHMPLFIVDRDEPGFGSYNCLDEPAREWLLGLFCEHEVELICTGHTHFSAFNTVGSTRLFGVPSTSFSRPGFNEVFPVLPDHRGKNDVEKLGFYLARVHADGVRMHLVRTNGETTTSEHSKKRLITRTSRDLPDSPLGVYLRHPLASITGGVHAWPDAVRQRVRDDYPLLACMELGVRHLRIPAADLQDDVQMKRLKVARDEGMQLTAVWLWSGWLNLVDEVKSYRDQLDTVELQVPGALLPEPACLKMLAQIRTIGIPISIAPLLAQEPESGVHHPRTRIGYRADELAVLDRHLSKLDMFLDKAVCLIEVAEHPWDQMETFTQVMPLSQISNLDFVVQFPGADENANAERAAEALFAAEMLAGCRIFFDPLVDVDRSSDINHGLLDRLSNPRSSFHALRCLNTILSASGVRYHPEGRDDRDKAGRVLGLASETSRLRLHLPDAVLSISPVVSDNFGTGRIENLSVDLKAGTSQLNPQASSEIDGRVQIKPI